MLKIAQARFQEDPPCVVKYLIGMWVSRLLGPKFQLEEKSSVMLQFSPKKITYRGPSKKVKNMLDQK